MRIAIISDLHANYEAMKAIAYDVESADVVLCLGDILGYYTQVNETMDWVRKFVSHTVLGNHDYFVLNGCPSGMPDAVRFGVEYAAKHIDPDHASWLSQLQTTWQGNLRGKSYLLAHGSPWNPLEDYLYADSPALDKLDRLPSDVIAVGQTHRYLKRNSGNKLRINPGSVGQSRDFDSRSCACAVIVHSKSLEVQRIIQPYDSSKVIDAARRNGAGSWIDKYLVC